MSPSPSVDSAATVELVEGDVRIFDNAKAMRRVRVTDPINEGESIVTGSDGEIHLHMLDGGTIAVRPNTKMRIAQFRAEGDDQDKAVIGLLVGTFRSITGWIGHFNHQGYLIRTPTATIGVRGTDHEPLVIPPGSADGEPGTYDKVNVGATYIRTPTGLIDVPENRAAFVPHGARDKGLAPRLLDALPTVYRPTHNEHLLEHRHESTQHQLEKYRNDRRTVVQQRKTAAAPTKAPSEGKRVEVRQPSADKGKQVNKVRKDQKKMDQQRAGKRRNDKVKRKTLPKED